MNIGIYLLRNEIDGKIYVGQSSNLSKRNRQHKNALLNNRHFNEHLQRAYNKYGNVFKFEIIEYCLLEMLDEREMYWINKFKANNKKYGYNILIGTTQFKKHSEESKEKIRKANQGSNNKLTISEVIEIKKELVKNYDIKKISIKYNVSKSTISKIGKCKNWSWVESNLNNKLLKRKEIEEELVKKEWLTNKNVSEISKKFGIGIRKVYNILNNEMVKKNNKIIKRNESIINDYKNGMSKSEILKKYNISKTTYVRITSKLYNQNRKEMINKVYEMKNKGISTIEISKKLKINPSTVNRYFKIANTEVI